MGAPGCDNAPVIEVKLTDKATPFTLIVPYYENPKFFARQLNQWKTLKRVKNLEGMSVIVIDDGSPDSPVSKIVTHEGPWPTWLRVFRINVDVRWNWLAARNIGAQYAADGWILMTDMDHMLTAPALRDVLYGARFEQMIYRFSRRESDGRKVHPHPNSWLMTREMFWKIGGYDETCSGYYGTDGDYRRRCAAAAPIRILTTELVRYEYDGDSSTLKYKRKQPEDAAVKKMIKARKPGWKPRVLSFPYHEVIVQ